MTAVQPDETVLATYRIRREWLLPPLIVLALLTAVVVVIAPGAWLRLAVGVVGVGLIIRAVLRLSRQTLTVTTAGVHLDTPAYRNSASWGDVQDVRRRHWLGIPHDELLLSNHQLERTGRISDRSLERLRYSSAAMRVPLTSFDADWRDGPLGEVMREHGIRPEV